MTSTATASWVSELAERHLDAAYNLGRWLLGNEHDAADAVHDAYLRAARSAHTYAGGNARAWWLAIVRNCCIAALNSRKRATSHADVGAVIDAAALADGARGSEAESG
ncbi:MAG: sigma factor, partial [Rhodanobacteraceae bacterium]